ncbi:hypothetical protein SAMN06295970_116108 [Noviherbaspirillum suwonense]|uniref:Uncharacterized protein n=1 Tax=Noviherbaspirillum suwonense TaxID=1224511 RepID=A0ABY1QHH0_9BURK|nr:hypothetical protein SAMN06295970_116108 [Noviherbaspirillum suwonense]
MGKLRGVLPGSAARGFYEVPLAKIKACHSNRFPARTANSTWPVRAARPAQGRILQATADRPAAPAHPHGPANAPPAGGNPVLQKMCRMPTVKPLDVAPGAWLLEPPLDASPTVKAAAELFLMRP